MKPLIVLLGETATGKSDVAVRLCLRIGGEVLSLDSMQVYTGIRVGTGVLPEADRQGVRHHLLEMVELDQPFSVGEFLNCYREALAEVRDRGAWPVLTAGTGLYLKSVLYGLFQGPGRDDRVRDGVRRELEEKGPERLHQRLSRLDPESARKIAPRDALRIVRALEVLEISGRPISEWQSEWEEPSEEAFLVGLSREREDLRERVAHRIERMLDDGWIEEVQSLLDKGLGAAIDRKDPIGYPELKTHLSGELSLEEAKTRILHRTMRLAKKQRTWFRSMPYVHWLKLHRTSSPSDVAEEVFACLEREGVLHD